MPFFATFETLSLSSFLCRKILCFHFCGFRRIILFKIFIFFLWNVMMFPLQRKSLNGFRSPKNWVFEINYLKVTFFISVVSYWSLYFISLFLLKQIVPENKSSVRRCYLGRRNWLLLSLSSSTLSFLNSW